MFKRALLVTLVGIAGGCVVSEPQEESPLYPPIEPLRTGYLAVSDDYELYWEVSGKLDNAHLERSRQTPVTRRMRLPTWLALVRGGNWLVAEPHFPFSSQFSHSPLTWSQLKEGAVVARCCGVHRRSLPVSASPRSTRRTNLRLDR